MLLLKTSLLILLLAFVNSRNAIDFFIKNKIVKSVEIHELEEMKNTSGRWIEYKYVFKQEVNNSVLNANLKVGIFTECYETIADYKIEFIKNLQESLNINYEVTKVSNYSKLLNNEIDLIICQPQILHPDLIQLHPIIKSK